MHAADTHAPWVALVAPSRPEMQRRRRQQGAAGSKHFHHLVLGSFPLLNGQSPNGQSG